MEPPLCQRYSGNSQDLCTDKAKQAQTMSPLSFSDTNHMTKRESHMTYSFKNQKQNIVLMMLLINTPQRKALHAAICG